MEDTQRNAHMYMCRRRVGCGFFYFFFFPTFPTRRQMCAEAEGSGLRQKL